MSVITEVIVKRNCLTRWVRRGQICSFYTRTVLWSMIRMRWGNLSKAIVMMKPKYKRIKMKYKKNKMMMMKRPKLMMRRRRKMILMGNSITMTMREWSLYKKMCYAVRNTRPEFRPAGCY